jgi:hypothetical protein
MYTQIQYMSEIKTVPFGDGMMTIENLTPVLSPREREKVRREIESRLFNVLLKYTNKKRR